MSLVLVLLVLGMRTLYAPLHLGQEEHFGSAAHPFSHEAIDDGRARGGHHHDDAHGDHDHDDHLPHPADDHVAELIVPKAASNHLPAASQARIATEYWASMTPGIPSIAVVHTELRPPRRRPRLAQPPRGPPSAS